MNTQKVVTVFTDIPSGATAMDKSFVKLYPELDYLFDEGMYIENIVQNHIANDRYMLTFIFRSYNHPQ